VIPAVSAIAALCSTSWCDPELRDLCAGDHAAACSCVLGCSIQAMSVRPVHFIPRASNGPAASISSTKAFRPHRRHALHAGADDGQSTHDIEDADVILVGRRATFRKDS